jgi:hypothetical protein
MSRQCRECRRLNPAEAVFCFHDGKPLANGSAPAEGSSIDFSTWAFPRPFVFPSGARCHNFVQLALTCHRQLQEAGEALQRGFLETFFSSLGRMDLALAAGAAARMPDRDRALDELLGHLPGSPLGAARLKVEPEEQSLGVLQVGDDRRFDLTLTNAGQRLLYGKVSVEDCPWLALGDGATPEKVFQFFDRAVIPVRVVGKRLRAYTAPQKAEIAVESNGGNGIVAVRVTVPVKPFTEGVLSGATTPRELAAKAKAHRQEAAALLESGAVARWYEANGWPYPVQGPTASGIAAVQQFFEVLGLVKTPKVELSEPAITLRGKPGERLEYVLAALTQENRAVVAHGTSDQPWLTVGKTVFRGAMASLPLLVESVPDQPGQNLTAHVKVTANGTQRFDVPVTLEVGQGRAAAPRARPAVATPAPPPPEVDVELVPLDQAPVALPVAAPAAPEAASVPLAGSMPIAASVPLAGSAVKPASGTLAATGASAGRRPPWNLLLPVAIVALGLLAALVHDTLFYEPADAPVPQVDHAHPVLDLHFHDAVLPQDFLTTPTMRFGLGIPDPKDPAKFKTRLIYDDYGRTCNVCVRIDKSVEYLLGVGQGLWKPPGKEPLGKDREGNRLIGAKAVWVRGGPPAVTVTQYVEIVPGGLSDDGSKLLLDTCLVRYDLTNDDLVAHPVALRFLLDMFIGNNDAVPFTIAGAKELCDTMKTFDKPADVPDYISALERQDVKNPGTVAHLVLKYGGGLEPPSRVTLGAWPASELRKHPGGERAERQDTGWEVPVLPMALAKSAENPNGDSAVTMYWDDKELLPKQTRTVGFAYGLGSVTGEKGEGQLGITAGGELAANAEFTLTAYVKNPAPGTTVTLTLPRGLRLAGGNEKEPVPPVPAGASSPYSPVTWRVKADAAGVKRVKVTLSTGAAVQHRLVIKRAEIFK